MAKVAKKPYFSHDIDACGDLKIKDLLFKLGNEGYGIYWRLVEFMHQNDFPTDKLKVVAHDLRIDEEKCKRVLSEFGLFREEDGLYISDRILRNLEEQKEKSKNASDNATKGHNKRIAEAVLKIYYKYFEKQYNNNESLQAKIAKVHRDNIYTTDDWDEIFSTAKRGWSFNGKIKIPTLYNILDKSELFRNDDYNLAPDKARIEENRKIKKHIEEHPLFGELCAYDAFTNIKTLEKQYEAIQILDKNISKGDDIAIQKCIEFCKNGGANG